MPSSNVWDREGRFRSVLGVKRFCGFYQAHLPWAQACPDGQAFPQAPQFFASLCRFVQVLTQAVWPLGQVGTSVLQPDWQRLVLLLPAQSC